MASEEEESCQTKDKEGMDGAGVSVKVGEEEDEGGGEGKAEVEGVKEDEEEPMFFSVGEVRRRLSQNLAVPRKAFERDPEDPSGKCSLSRMAFLGLTSINVYMRST